MPSQGYAAANGRIDFVQIEKADDHHITFAARQAGSDHRVIGELTAAGEKSAQIERLNFIGLMPQ